MSPPVIVPTTQLEPSARPLVKGGVWVRTVKNFFSIFYRNFFESPELASWHAALARSWLAALRTRLRAILFSFYCTRRRPGDTRRGLAEVAARFLRKFALQGVSFRISRFRGSAAPWPANPGQVAFAAELFISSKRGSALYQHLKRVDNDMKSKKQISLLLR